MYVIMKFVSFRNLELKNIKLVQVTLKKEKIAMGQELELKNF